MSFSATLESVHGIVHVVILHYTVLLGQIVHQFSQAAAKKVKNIRIVLINETGLWKETVALTNTPGYMRND